MPTLAEATEAAEAVEKQKHRHWCVQVPSTTSLEQTCKMRHAKVLITFKFIYQHDNTLI